MIKYKDLCDYDLLLKEYHTIKSKTVNKKKISNYELYLGSNITLILDELVKRCYHHDKYNIFIISEPKYRIIMSEKMKDKIVNHLISNNVLTKIIEPLLIDANVATRKGKGTSYGIKLMLKYINKLKLNNDKIYVLKMDIKKYFFNINHDILLSKLNKIIKDEEIFKLVENIIRSSDEKYVNESIIKVKNNKITVTKNRLNQKSIKDLPEYQKGCGLPIGNLSSQILAIFYLNDIDHFIKEKLHLKYYIRYMDDLVILGNNYQYLKNVESMVRQQIKKLNLELNNKTKISDLNNGVSFLGYNFKLRGQKIIIRINNPTKYRIKKKIRNLKKYNLNKLVKVKASYKGYLMISNCNIKKILN